MNRVNPYISATYFRIGQSCIAAAVVSTFAINPISNYDPISVVKMLPLTLFVFFGAGLFFSNKGLLLNLISEHKLIVGLIASFWIFMISSIFGSGASFLQQFWGTFGRNTGFLTYFSLSLLFLIFVSVSNPYNVRNVRTALLFSSIPMTIYACLQYAKRDPVTWSEQAVLAHSVILIFYRLFLA
jgi:hypothetical protein